MIGKTVSHYKILEKLGGGGMGIVYKAQDLKLDRLVALKFLPPCLSTNDDEKQRFIHEAKAASALDHSNICTIFEIGETKEGQLFIAMAYYEGETLKEKIKKRPLLLKEVVDIATQMAAGLSKAHEAGIIHRDVKPANVIVTKEGEVKIVDFGLAKLTGQTKLTKPGSTLGTISYMSPEQLRGEKTDSRSDIWSLGVVIYEMITGHLPFKGDYEQAITYAILNEEPEPITALRTGVPVEFERIVNKTLAKDQKQRYKHVDEMPIDLQAINLALSGTSRISRAVASENFTKTTAVQQKKITWKVAAPLLIVAIILTSIITWLLKPHPDQPEKSVLNFVYTHDPSKYVYFYPPLISPDGKKIVYVADPEGVYNLYLSRLDQLSNVLPIIENLSSNNIYPFFSPDSRDLCFFLDGKLKKVNIDGGPVHEICDISPSYGGTWGDDGTIIFASDGKGLLQISASSVGGTPKVLVSPDSGQSRSYYLYPEMLPASKAVLYTAWEGRSRDEANIAVYSLETGKSTLLITKGTHPLYSPTGHIVFARSESYFAVPFDVKRLRITGREVPVQEEVRSGHLRFSNNGTLIYIPYKPIELSLHLVDRFGRETLFTNIKRNYRESRFSPDGTRVAFVSRNEKTGLGEIWIHDVIRNVQSLITSEGSNHAPEWTPDGKEITFRSNRSGVYNIWVKRADGTGNAKPLFPSENYQRGGSWSADGTLFAFYQFDITTQADIWIYNTRDSTASPFLSTPNWEYHPAFSLDGKCIAYTSDRTGKSEIYVTSYPGPGPQLPVSTEGGEGSFWAPDGQELFYRNGDKMMVVPISTGQSLKPGRPELLFEKHYVYDKNSIHYDIHPNGKQFLMAKDDPYNCGQINIVLNWFEVLKEKMASAKQ